MNEPVEMQQLNAAVEPSREEGSFEILLPANFPDLAVAHGQRAPVCH